MIRQKPNLIGGSIAVEINRLWDAIRERTPLPHGEQVVNRTTKGFSIQGGGLGGAAIGGGAKSGTISAINSSSLEGVTSVTVDSGGASYTVDAPPNLRAHPKYSGGTIWNANLEASILPEYTVGDTIYFLNGDGFNIDLNVDARIWVEEAGGCDWDSSTGAYNYVTHNTALSGGS
tara:strand:- start:1214 stop:1738 length:525 start_codon:yes stop_codon:yes gene_type:complete